MKAATDIHVVAIPYPGRGHVNPMMNICKQLVSKVGGGDKIRITFIVTQEWFGFLQSESRPSQIQLHSIPNVIPSELVRALDFPTFLEAVYTKMEGPIEQLLDQLLGFCPPVSAIIADTYMTMAVSIGNRRNIPVVSLWTMSPFVFSVFFHLDLLSHNGHFPIDLSEHGDEMIDYIPGISPTRLADFPTIFDGVGSRVVGRVMETFDMVRKAQCLLFTSFHELQTEVVETLTESLPFPVYSIGPSIPHITIGHTEDQIVPFSDTANITEDYIEWLNIQPKSSVLYVSLGSFLSVSKEQMNEILGGLEDSRVRYLLVSRGSTSSGSVGDEKMNFVVPWCNQLRVLCHSSVGGFWTHCGWNSTLEGVFAGVPMLTFPIFFDQLPDRKLIVDDWKVGMKVTGAERLITRKEIAEIVKKFIDLDDDEGKEMRKRSMELKKSCRRALAKGGSSDTNLNSFIRDFLKCDINY